MTGKKQNRKRLASSVLSLLTLLLIGSVIWSCDYQEKGLGTIVRTFVARLSSITKTSLSAEASVSWDKYDQIK